MGAKHSRQNIMMHQHHRHRSERRGSLRTSNKEHIASISTSSVAKSTNSVTIEGRQYHHDESTSYCLPRDELEQDRLNSQHFSLKALLEGNVLPSVPKSIAENAKVLDLGCGSGCWVMEMAIDYPDYHVTGADMADMFPTTIRPENVEFELYNILNGLPYPDNSFDFVHMRLMIIALRSSEWPLVLNEIFRVLKPGGLVELVESDFTEKTNLEIVETFNNAFHKAMQEVGQDPWIGPKLSAMLTDISFDIVEIQEKYLNYGLPSDPIVREMFQNWKGAMLSIKPLLAHRLTENTDLYSSIVDRYMEGITQAGWRVKILAICARKPIATVEEN